MRLVFWGRLLSTIIWSKNYLRLLFWGGYYSRAVTIMKVTVDISQSLHSQVGKYTLKFPAPPAQNFALPIMSPVWRPCPNGQGLKAAFQSF